MTNSDDTKIEECECKAKELDHCPEDQKVDGKCPDQTKTEQAPSWVNELKTQMSSISGLAEKLSALEAKIGVREAPTPTAKIGDGSKQFSLAESLEKMKRWAESDRSSNCIVEIPVDVLRGINVSRVKTSSGIREVYRNQFDQEHKIREALGYTGTQAGQDADIDVAMEAGGFSFVPVTQYAKYKELKQGTDRARFFKHDLPAPATQTPGTTATIGTMDIESIEVTPSTITGVHLEIDTDDIENNPYDTVSVITRASAARFDDFIATDMLDTVSAEGTLTPLAWIKGSDGTTITSSDAASVAFDPTGLATAVEKLEDQGYLKSGIKPVAFLHPKQFRELIEDPELSNYVQFAKPDITQNFAMAELYGCTIVRTNAIQKKTAQTNPAYNAIVAIPNHSYGVGSARSVTIKLQDKPEENQVWATTSWRIKAGVIDANSIVRVSTSA